MIETGQVIRYRVEWWTQQSGSLKTQQCKLKETADHMFIEKAGNAEVVEVRIIEERMIAQHINGKGSCGDVHPD